MDEVDRIMEAWRHEVPRLDVRPLAVLSRVSRLARHFELARKRVFAAHQLDGWEFDVLAALRRGGPPYDLSPGALIQQTLSTSGTMTNRIDRLAGRGLVERGPDPHDRRGVRVRLTEEGRDVVERALADLLTMERSVLSVLSDDEAAQLAALLRRVLGPFEHQTT